MAEDLENGRVIRDAFLALPDRMQLHYGIIDPPGIEPLFTLVTIPGLGELVAKKDFELGATLAMQRARHIVYDPRGQGKSSRFLDGAGRQRAYVPSFQSYIDDLQSFFDQIVQRERKGKVILYGHSTGGLTLLSWLAQRPPKNIVAAIVSSPVLGLRIPPQRLFGSAKAAVPTPLALAIAGGFVARGSGKEYAWGEHDYAPDFDDHRLTHNRDRFQWLGNYFASHPDETTGGATWTWLYETLRRGAVLRVKNELRRIACPLLTILGGDDRVVPSERIAAWMQCAPTSEIVTIPGSYHEVMNEDETYRRQALAAFIEFIKRHAL